MKLGKRFILIFFFLSLMSFGERIYLSPRDFVISHFPNYRDKLKFIHLSADHQEAIYDLIENTYPINTLRFWGEDEKTLWILEDIGKTERITMGFVVEKDAISSVEILIYRESHGSEVHHQSFTNQFQGITLKNNKLDKKIFNIAGATLSVEAVKRMSILSLFLHRLAKNIDE